MVDSARSKYMKVVILGCGASAGTPVIGCDCAACVSNETRNKRRRASVYVENAGVKLLIDTSPDLRQQALDNKIVSLDAVLYTHDHADHIAGIDDVKSFAFLAGRPIPMYSNEETMTELEQRFSFVFHDPRLEGSKCNTHGRTFPFAISNKVIPGKEFQVEGVKILPILQKHGKGFSLAYRIGNFAYSTDFNSYEESNLMLLQDLDLWIIDCIGYKTYPAHIGLDQALAYIEKLKPKLAVLTHMSHEIDYSDLSKRLPKNVVLAYDNMAIEL